MIRHSVAVVLLLLAWCSTQGRGQSLTENSYVTVDLSVVAGSGGPDTAAVLLFQFRPADDIHLVTEPAVRFTLDSGSCVQLLGAPTQHADPRTGFLDTAQALSVALAPQPGTGGENCRAGGTITYFFCSDSQGWCRSWRQHVTFTVAERGHSSIHGS